METFIGLFVHVHVHDSGYLKRIVEVVPRVHEGWYSVDVEYQQGLIKFQICEFGKEDTVITLDNLRDLAILLRNVLLNGPYVFISLHDNLANYPTLSQILLGDYAYPNFLQQKNICL